jgi:hypothetical protein
MSLDALLKLRDDIEKTLSSRAAQLRDELSKLSGRSKPTSHPLKGRKAPVKYRDRQVTLGLVGARNQSGWWLSLRLAQS